MRMTVSFGDLTLDTDTRQIRRGAVEVHISPKAFELLTALIDARPAPSQRPTCTNGCGPTRM